MAEQTHCWCGNTTQFEAFSPDYVRCGVCGTLVSINRLSDQELRVNDDAHDFYGKEYWLSHQAEDYGYPTIQARMREDFSNRCLHWLKALLKYRLPPAKTLELGAGSGAFIGLLKLAGFDASGLELSPWIVELISSSFGVPMLLGPIEQQSIEPHSLDVIILMDVLEHLPDPVGTMQRCLTLLTDGGLLVIQTPEYRNQTYAEMVAADDIFLVHITKASREHLYLFTRGSIRLLFERIGVTHLAFEPPMFAYDMFAFVSSTPFDQIAPAKVDNIFASSVDGRATEALLDLYERTLKLQGQIELVQNEADKRLADLESEDRQLRELQAQIGHLEAAANERLTALHLESQRRSELEAQLKISETAASERLRLIQSQDQQIQDLNKKVAMFEHAAEERLALINKLSDELERRASTIT